MSLGRSSVKGGFLLVCGGETVSMLSICALLFAWTGELWILTGGILLTVCALLWLFLLMLFFRKRLLVFTRDLCRAMDQMISGGKEPVDAADSETLFSRISYRLLRLYRIMQENRRKVEEERQELQMLVSDVSHQVKMPVSNLKMVADTLLTKPVTEEESREFLQGIRSQTDKLEFLFQSLVRTSRLEIGTIRLEKKDGPLIDTLAFACSGIVYAAEKKDISVTVDCPDDLRLSHDSKWTAEALFNLLDNAVKYTPVGGKISVSVERWEMYVKLDVTDTGKGIPESNQAAVFRRFYREEEVHGQQGVGIGLYLAREIVTRQGGYIKVTSEVGKGSTFSVFLPWR
ncbi:MAG: HAMP domain-containing histidine kinase [Lachnospiraceae bacterium]|nr:HAMP domain-containing histidine kinase [Lachnospiraceae bacterium]